VPNAHGLCRGRTTDVSRSRSEPEAFWSAHGPPFYRATADRLPEQWDDQCPFRGWHGRYPVVEVLE
jgi:hypothetical protein